MGHCYIMVQFVLMMSSEMVGLVFDDVGARVYFRGFCFCKQNFHELSVIQHRSLR